MLGFEYGLSVGKSNAKEAGNGPDQKVSCYQHDFSWFAVRWAMLSSRRADVGCGRPRHDRRTECTSSRNNEAGAGARRSGPLRCARPGSLENLRHWLNDAHGGRTKLGFAAARA